MRTIIALLVASSACFSPVHIRPRPTAARAPTPHAVAASAPFLGPRALALGVAGAVASIATPRRATVTFLATILTTTYFQVVRALQRRTSNSELLREVAEYECLQTSDEELCNVVESKDWNWAGARQPIEARQPQPRLFLPRLSVPPVPLPSRARSLADKLLDYELRVTLAARSSVSVLDW